jgi:tetratricopeptide (TPR) repeat protein
MEYLNFINLPSLITGLTSTALVILFTALYKKGSWTREHKMATNLEYEGDKLYHGRLWDNAIEQFEKSIAIWEKEMRISHTMGLYKKLARCYTEKGEVDKAMQYLIKCEAAWDSLKKGIKIYEVYDELALLYLKKGELNIAKEYSQRAVKEQRASNSVRIPVSLAIAARIAKEHDDFEQAERLYLESVEYLESLNDIYGLASVLYDLAELKRQQKSLEKAAIYYKKSVIQFEKLGSPRASEIEERLMSLVNEQ